MSFNLDLLGLFDAGKKVKKTYILSPNAEMFHGDDYHMVESANKKSHQQTLNKSKFMEKGQHSNRSRCSVFLPSSLGDSECDPRFQTHLQATELIAAKSLQMMVDVTRRFL